MVVIVETSYTVLTELTFLKVLQEQIAFFVLRHDGGDSD
jgi:hypothetical protein